MGVVFADKECKQLTPGAAKIVWFIVIPVMIVSSLLNHLALIIWGLLLATIAIIATFMGK